MIILDFWSQSGLSVVFLFSSVTVQYSYFGQVKREGLGRLWTKISWHLSSLCKDRVEQFTKNGEPIFSLDNTILKDSRHCRCSEDF